MKIKMKAYEILAVSYAKRFAKTWDYWTLAKDAYLQGYRDGAEVPEGLNHEVTGEIEAGEHQLSIASFQNWEKANQEHVCKHCGK